MDEETLMKIDGDFVVVELSDEVYDLDVIYSASYQLLDDCYVVIDKKTDSRFEVMISLQKSEDINDMNLRNKAKEFYNSLIDCKYYQINTASKETTRSLVLAKSLNYQIDENCNVAASNPNNLKEAQDEFTDEDFDDEDFEFDDPEGIAIPWEEKYSDNDDSALTDEIESSQKNIDNSVSSTDSELGNSPASLDDDFDEDVDEEDSSTQDARAVDDKKDN